MTPEPTSHPGRDAHPAASVSNPARRILFLCVHNSARSQIAEALARQMAPPGTEIWSAGSSPRTIHPMALEVLHEAGLEVEGLRSKSIDEVPWQEADTVVSVCAEGDESCPVLPATIRRVRWPLPDPTVAEESRRLQAFRETREELRWRVSSLWPRGD